MDAKTVDRTLEADAWRPAAGQHTAKTVIGYDFSLVICQSSFVIGKWELCGSQSLADFEPGSSGSRILRAFGDTD
jgi:hypothetical protein